jgi:hypothetical protein
VIFDVVALHWWIAITTSWPPSALISTPPALGGLKSHQAVFP